jgi:hypothetical protein
VNLKGACVRRKTTNGFVFVNDFPFQWVRQTQELRIDAVQPGQRARAQQAVQCAIYEKDALPPKLVAAEGSKALGAPFYPSFPAKAVAGQDTTPDLIGRNGIFIGHRIGITPGKQLCIASSDHPMHDNPISLRKDEQVTDFHFLSQAGLNAEPVAGSENAAHAAALEINRLDGW